MFDKKRKEEAAYCERVVGGLRKKLTEHEKLLVSLALIYPAITEDPEVREVRRVARSYGFHHGEPEFLDDYRVHEINRIAKVLLEAEADEKKIEEKTATLKMLAEFRKVKK